jgi:putative transposase
MQAHQQDPALSIRHLCSVLEVNRAWYYTRQEEQPGSDAEVALRDAIELIVVEFPGYGYRRVTHALQRAGWTINHKHVLRVMRGCFHKIWWIIRPTPVKACRAVFFLHSAYQGGRFIL